MNIEDKVTEIATEEHRKVWSSGSDVSAQTKKSQRVCIAWQRAVEKKIPKRFSAEVPLDKKGRSQKIDLVDEKDRVPYELKSSPNNVHMEIYRDVFKALAFNERSPDKTIKTLVFLAPQEGIKKLGVTFPKDVQTISARVGLKLKIRELP